MSEGSQIIAAYEKAIEELGRTVTHLKNPTDDNIKRERSGLPVEKIGWIYTTMEVSPDSIGSFSSAEVALQEFQALADRNACELVVDSEGVRIRLPRS